MSNPPILFSREATRLIMRLGSARSLSEKISLLAKFRPRHFKPNPPGVTEPSTGLTMGQHMEITAKQLKISRTIQDEIALKSHQNAANAASAGVFAKEIAPLGSVTIDTIVRKDTSLEKLKTLKPVFDRSASGTITAGNASPLTDGASALLLMSESKAKALGYEPLAFVRAYEYSAIAPDEGLLMAPAVAVPRLLRREGLTFADFDLIEIHEAFGAQVAANVQAWEQGWKESAISGFDWAKVNTLGGSIAIGHPFAATGGRIVTTLANELKRKNLRRGLISICAAGAMAGALILERS
jgi:acetyl-CoA acetyltransferase family protein